MIRRVSTAVADAPVSPGWVLGAAAIAALGALQALLAYHTSPALAAAAGLVLVAIAVIAPRPIVGVCLGILAVPLEVLDLRLGQAGLSPAEGLFLLAAGAAVLQFVAKGRMGAVHPAHLGFMGLLFVICLGLFFADDIFVIAKIGAMWTAFLVLSLLVAHSEPVEQRRVVVCLVASGAAVALVAIMGAESQSVVGGGARVTNRAQASFGHPNVLAFFLVLTLPLALALGVTGPVRPRPFFLAAAGLIATGLVLTSTRGALVGVGVALLIMLAGTPYRRMALGFVTVIAVIAVLNPSAVLERPEVSVVGTRLSTIATGKETSTNPRIEIWEKAPEIIADYPLLGVGEGNFAPVSLRYGLYDVDADGLPYDHAHNIFLTVTAELGLVGLALLLFLLFSVLRTVIATLRDREAPEFLPALALTAALVGILANGMTDYPPRTNVIMAVILLEIGLLIALERGVKGRGGSEKPL